MIKLQTAAEYQYFNIEKGDICEPKVTPCIIMHGVNCQNVMGSGVAKALYYAWPEVKEMYHYRFHGSVDTEKELLGTVQFVLVKPAQILVANCFTQVYYGKDGKKYANELAIMSCLRKVLEHASNAGIKHVYSPTIGCGLGGCNWPDVELCMSTELQFFNGYSGADPIQLTVVTL